MLIRKQIRARRHFIKRAVVDDSGYKFKGLSNPAPTPWQIFYTFRTAAGPPQSVERLIAKRDEVAGLITQRNEGTSFALKRLDPSRCLDEQVKWLSRLQQDT